MSETIRVLHVEMGMIRAGIEKMVIFASSDNKNTADFFVF